MLLQVGRILASEGGLIACGVTIPVHIQAPS